MNAPTVAKLPPSTNEGGNVNKSGGVGGVGGGGETPSPYPKAGIDWLTATVSIDRVKRSDIRDFAGEVLSLVGEPGKTKDVKPYPHNYKRGISAGLCTASWHPDRPDMKLCLNWTGSALTTIYSEKRDPENLVSMLAAMGASFTRLDVAIDVLDIPADLGSFVDTIRASKSTIAHKITPYTVVDLPTDNAAVTGVYLGSRSSDRYIQVYNKALEMKLPDALWTRIEIRNRKAKAQQIIKAAQSVDRIDRETGEIRSRVIDAARGVIREHTYPEGIDWWKLATSGDYIPTKHVGRKETDTDRWLLETVAPVLARRMKETDPETAALLRREFLNALGETWKPIQ